jgi:hypothetical protein
MEHWTRPGLESSLHFDSCLPLLLLMVSTFASFASLSSLFLLFSLPSLQLIQFHPPRRLTLQSLTPSVPLCTFHSFIHSFITLSLSLSPAIVLVSFHRLQLSRGELLLGRSQTAQHFPAPFFSFEYPIANAPGATQHNTTLSFHNAVPLDSPRGFGSGCACNRADMDSLQSHERDGWNLSQ